MSPKGKVYRPEYALELLAIADGDLQSAKGLLSVRVGRLENICFLSQQSVEKSLTALLCFYGKSIVHTHDLESIIQNIPNYEEIPSYANLDALTQYALIRRYEQGFEILQDEDLQIAVDAAASVLEYEKKKIRG